MLGNSDHLLRLIARVAPAGFRLEKIGNLQDLPDVDFPHAFSVHNNHLYSIHVPIQRWLLLSATADKWIYIIGRDVYRLQHVDIESRPKYRGTCLCGQAHDRAPFSKYCHLLGLFVHRNRQYR